MVAPLLTGAVKVARIKRAQKKAGGSKSAIANRRNERLGKAAAELRRAQNYELSEEQQKRQENVRKMRNILPYRKALQRAEKGSNIATAKKTKAFNRGILTLGSVLFPMALQPIFALLALFALAIEDSWWGWIDIIDASLVAASISWIIALALGTYTMLIASFMMGKYFNIKHLPVVLVFMICFSANWVPGIQIVPWVAIWIAYVIYHEKSVHTA